MSESDQFTYPLRDHAFLDHWSGVHFWSGVTFATWVSPLIVDDEWSWWWSLFAATVAALAWEAVENKFATTFLAANVPLFEDFTGESRTNMVGDLVFFAEGWALVRLVAFAADQGRNDRMKVPGAFAWYLGAVGFALVALSLLLEPQLYVKQSAPASARQ